jgi:hypothetical protein
MRKTARNRPAMEEAPLSPMVLALGEVVRGDLRAFVVNAGMTALAAFLERERTEICGPRYARQADRRVREVGMRLESWSWEGAGCASSVPAFARRMGTRRYCRAGHCLRARTRRNPEEALRAVEALLDEPLRFTPTPDKHSIIEGPVFLGTLFPDCSDSSGIRTRVPTGVPSAGQAGCPAAHSSQRSSPAASRSARSPSHA